MCGSEAVCQAAHTHTHKSIRTHTTGRCSELLEEPEVSQFDKESLHINCFITRHLSEAALHPCVCVQSLVYQCVFLLWSCACVCVCVCWMNRVKPACLGNKKPQNKKVLKAFGNNQSRICRAARPSALSSLLPPPCLALFPSPSTSHCLPHHLFLSQYLKGDICKKWPEFKCTVAPKLDLLTTFGCSCR